MDPHTHAVPEDARASDAVVSDAAVSGAGAGFEAFDEFAPSGLAPLDPTDAFNLHRAINERRAQVENPELLKHLRSL
ncbi:hypothetical protein [Phenylobacterium sp.]|uniref:hypothetical protein n=1 Tax=Phenylobacterium sp. TaxID=1871053 RepID=UPI00301C0A91